MVLHDLLCGDPLLLAVLEKLGDQVLGRPRDGVAKLRVEMVVGGADMSPVLKLQTSSVTSNKSVAIFISPFLF
jgi:hypothetical protein